MNKHKGLSPKGREILKELNRGLRDGMTLSIIVDSQTGKVIFKVAQKKIGQYMDVYDAIEDLLPEGYLEELV